MHGYVQITSGINKGRMVKVIGQWPTGRTVTSPNGGRAWTLREGEFTQVPCRMGPEDK